MAREDQYPLGFSTSTISRIWDGTTIKLFGGKGELLFFYVYLNVSAAGDATNVMVKLSSFTGTGTALGSGFSSVQVSSTNAWDYTQRPYSLYKYGYLQQIGMSQVDIAWDRTEYDEQQLPPRWRVPCSINANNACPADVPTQLFANRLDKNKFYPDAAVPIEEFSISSFTISASSSQAIGGEVYISTDLPAGLYTSTLTVTEGVTTSTTIPVQVLVYNVTLPATASLPVLGFVQLQNFSTRLNGTRNPANLFVDPYLTNILRVGAFMHRHKVTMVGNDITSGQNYPSPAWQKFLDGSAYKETYGMAYNTGPGYGVAESTHVIGTYGNWVSVNWSTGPTAGTDDFCTNASSYTAWCVTHGKTCYLYTPDDEAPPATIHDKDNAIAQLLSTSTPCAYNGSRIQFAQTGTLPTVMSTAPYINAVWSVNFLTSPSATWLADESLYQNSSTHSVAGYNSAVGVDSIMSIQEEGLGPREPLWGAYKTGQSLWFLWSVNYWNDVNNPGSNLPMNGFNPNANRDNDLFNLTKDFGYDDFPSTDAAKGHTGFNWTSGDGNMLYPATDVIFANPNYGFNGVIGSWRLNQVTRGIQDIDILKSAFAVWPTSATYWMNQQVQDVMYLRDCFTHADCTYSYGPRPWNQSLNSWDTTREALLKIIQSASPNFPGSQNMQGGISFKGGSKLQ